MTDNKVIQFLKEAKIKLRSKEHKGYKFSSKGTMANMDLNIEHWLDGDDLVVSMCHYGEMNGDLMRDPDVVFKIDKQKNIIPLSYRNDYMATMYQCTHEKEQKSLMIFLHQWIKNIKEQGFLKNGYTEV